VKIASLVFVISLARWLVLAEDKHALPPVGPDPIQGIDGYGFVLTGMSRDEHFQMQIVDMRGESASGAYQVIDSFGTCVVPMKCGDKTISYIQRQDSCFHIITIGPLPSVREDTLVTSCFPDTVGWGITGHVLDKADSLLVCLMQLFIRDPITARQCLVGKCRPDRLVDTIALLPGVTSFALSPDRTELFVDVIFGLDEDNWPKLTIGMFDMETDSLTYPLDKTYNTWAGSRLSRDQSLYYIKKHSVFGTNVWRWSPEWGEELVTSFVRPDVVREYDLTSDSLICLVGMESDSASTGVTRVAVPLDSD